MTVAEKEARAKEQLERMLGYPIDASKIWVNDCLIVGRVILAYSFGWQWIDSAYRCVYPQRCTGPWSRLLTMYLYAKHDFDYLNEKAN